MKTIKELQENKKEIEKQIKLLKIKEIEKEIWWNLENNFLSTLAFSKSEEELLLSLTNCDLTYDEITNLDYSKASNHLLEHVDELKEIYKEEWINTQLEELEDRVSKEAIKGAE